MSNTTKKIIIRQWHILNFLMIQTAYVSTKEIQTYLKSIGLSENLRTLQRDLKMLQDIMPIESRTDSKPYSWRWQRLPDINCSDMTLTQALAFQLVETDLKPHIPTDLLEQLEPVLIKARFTLMRAQYQRIEAEKSHLKHSEKSSRHSIKQEENDGHKLYFRSPSIHTQSLNSLWLSLPKIIKNHFNTNSSKDNLLLQLDEQTYKSLTCLIRKPLPSNQYMFDKPLKASLLILSQHISDLSTGGKDIKLDTTLLSQIAYDIKGYLFETQN
ncbi:MAG: hypothetical protein Q4P13_03475 [Psychrobacter sp.]|nr:hypothetical protein [Psychrobacter sp.]